MTPGPVIRGPVIPWRSRWQVPAIVVAAAVLAAGPVLFRRGFVLVGDMSFVPHQPWKSTWLGLDGSAPRAVPADAIVSLLSHIVPGDLLQKAILLGALIGAGWGAARLVRVHLDGGRAAAAGAGVLYLWNPYVYERLAIGHWGLLLGYAALPWVVLAALAVRRAEPASWARLLLASAPAVLGSPTGGIIAALVALVLVLGDRRRFATVLGVVALVNLPWLVPGLTGAEAGDDPGGVHAFAARADTPLGVLGSLLSLGGIWKDSIVPGERDSWFLVTLAVLAALAALALLARRRGEGDLGLLALGGVGLVLAALPAIGPGADLARALVEHVPGAGILRDSQKWLALLALAVAAGYGLVLSGVAAGVRRLGLPALPFQAGLILLPLVVLPTMAWGQAGDLDPVRYPAEWTTVQRILEQRPTSERSTVSLPFSAYQRLPWNDGRAALDPALRFLPGRVVPDDRLTVGDRTVAGDSPTAARIAAAVRDGVPLAPVLSSAGIRFVLIERTAAGAAKLTVPEGRVLHLGPELELIDLGTPAARPRADHPELIVVGDLLTGAGLVVSVFFLALRRIRRRSGEIG